MPILEFILEVIVFYAIFMIVDGLYKLAFRRWKK